MKSTRLGVTLTLTLGLLACGGDEASSSDNPGGGDGDAGLETTWTLTATGAYEGEVTDNNALFIVQQDRSLEVSVARDLRGEFGGMIVLDLDVTGPVTPGQAEAFTCTGMLDLAALDEDGLGSCTATTCQVDFTTFEAAAGASGTLVGTFDCLGTPTQVDLTFDNGELSGNL